MCKDEGRSPERPPFVLFRAVGEAYMLPEPPRRSLILDVPRNFSTKLSKNPR